MLNIHMFFLDGTKEDMLKKVAVFYRIKVNGDRFQSLISPGPSIFTVWNSAVILLNISFGVR